MTCCCGNELTEATTANVMVEVDGERVTPPISSGIAGGHLQGGGVVREGQVRERVVSRDDPHRATGLWLMNSVQARAPPHLMPSQSPGGALSSATVFIPFALPPAP